MELPAATRTWHDLHYRHTEPTTHPRMWRPFIEIDPFNPQNKVAGHIQFTGGDEYGALAISHVNDRPAPQFIRVTPKASYPFHKDGSWVLHGAKEVSAFEKIDGTNVCQYGYQDAVGLPYTSFKLRTRPFMSPNFQNLLERALENYPALRAHQLNPGEAVAYELFGYENRMLIRYNTAIDLVLLFGRNAGGDLMTPYENAPLFDGIDCPAAGKRPMILTEDLEGQYRERQQEISSRLVSIGDEYFDGEEGEMLYVRFAHGAREKPGDFTRLIKLKPPEIQVIHWALDHVPKAEAAAVARNIFEVSDTPQLDDMVQLLSEEWSSEQIARSLETVKSVLQESIERRSFQEEVLTVYAQFHGPEDFRQNGPAVMRSMSQRFARAQMSKIYAILVERGFG